MNPQDIFSKIKERYGSCTTYRDRGCLYSWDERNQKTAKPQIVFRSYFEWPSKFRFEWQDDSSSAMIWCDGKDAFRCYNFHNSGTEIQPCENYGMALAGAHGVSKGSVSLIADLLFDDLRTANRWLLIRAEEKLVGTEMIGGDECYYIQGSNFSPNDTSVWISDHDWSLKRHRHLTVKDEPASNSQTWAANQNSSKYSIDLGLLKKVLKERREAKNSITPKEIVDFSNLFTDSSGVVDKEIHGNGNYFTEITIEKMEFGTRIPPAIFTHIKREVDDF